MRWWVVCGDFMVEGLMKREGDVGKIWLALVALAVELIVLAWFVGSELWEFAGAAIAEW